MTGPLDPVDMPRLVPGRPDCIALSDSQLVRVRQWAIEQARELSPMSDPIELAARIEAYLLCGRQPEPVVVNLSGEVPDA